VVDGILTNPASAKKRLKEHDRTIRYGLKTFSWFIYRITQPAMRNMFMGPRNWFRIEEGILSLLAGDLFADTKIKFPLFMFKVIYYCAYFMDWRVNRDAYLRRLNSLNNGESLVEETSSRKSQVNKEVRKNVANG